MAKMSCKSFVKSLLAGMYFTPLSRLSGAKTLPILCYHSINDTQNEESQPLEVDLFERHLAWLSTHYNVIPLSDLIARLRSDDPIEEDVVAITFDDGYRDNFEIALPLLEKYKCHATFFIVSDFINGEVVLNGQDGWEPMTWAQVKKMDRSPYAEIGVHSKTHRMLSSLSDDDLRSEILDSKICIEQHLDRQVDLFAFPNGQGDDMPEKALELLKTQGYQGGCSTFWRTTQKPEQSYVLNRLMIFQSDTVHHLKQKLDGKFDYLYFVHKVMAFIKQKQGGKGIWRV